MRSFPDIWNRLGEVWILLAEADNSYWDFDYCEYRISLNNSRPWINRPPPLTEVFKIIASPTSVGYSLGIAIVELGGWSFKVESDSAKLISDDSSSDAAEIGSKN